MLTHFLELAYDGLVLHLAMGRPVDDLEPVLDLVETAVRRAGDLPPAAAANRDDAHE